MFSQNVNWLSLGVVLGTLITLLCGSYVLNFEQLMDNVSYNSRRSVKIDNNLRRDSRQIIGERRNCSRDAYTERDIYEANSDVSSFEVFGGFFDI
jgi:hypothetical protein